MKVNPYPTACFILVLFLAACAQAPPVIVPVPTNSPIPPTSAPQTPTALPPTEPVPTATTTLELIPTNTSTPTEIPPTEIIIPVEPDWSGEWEVFIGNPRISIVKPIQFMLPSGDDLTVRAEWYEGTRYVYLDAMLSEDGRTITGTFWNTDIEALDIVLTMSLDGTYFTGRADSEVGPGQFCGTRPGGSRPSPCRGEGN